MADTVKVKRVLGGPLTKGMDVTLSRDQLLYLGNLFVKLLAKESRRYFAKRGWTGEDPMGGPPIWDSFKAEVKGERTLEVGSSFYGLKELIKEGVPRRRMTWLTQEAKDRRPSDFPLTDREKKLGMKQTGKVSKGKRLPLIVPLTGVGGTILFRTAPLKFSNAWVHPGIARFSFFHEAARKWRQDVQKNLNTLLMQAIREKMKKRMR